MATKIRETEWKYDAPAGARLPDLTRVPHVDHVTGPEKQTLKAAYHDTDDLRLIKAGITLRRRDGGNDAGWHLKLPEGAGTRVELRLPPSGDMPEELPALVHAWTRGRDVHPVARITTKRQRHLLQDQAGSTLAEVVLDDVTAETLGSTMTVTRWREVEVELVEGGPGLLAATDKQLRRSGLVRSERAAKLERALADRLPDPAGAQTPGLTRTSTAGDVVLTYLRTHVEQLVAWDPRLRRDEPDSVHKMRVATRRLRSALKAFGSLFDPSATDPLQDELKWLGQVLGDARDEEVLCEHLLESVSSLPAELAVGPVQARIVGHFAPRQVATRADVLTVLDGERYVALLDALDAFLDSPPLTPAAGKPAKKVLPKRAGKALRRVDRRVNHALDLAPGPHREVALHQARKAAKQARYTAEALEPVDREQSRRSVKTAKKLQSILGDHQDAVIVGRVLRELGMLAHASRENGFTYGLLYERTAGSMPQLQAEAERFWHEHREERHGWES